MLLDPNSQISLDIDLPEGNAPFTYALMWADETSTDQSDKKFS